MMMIAIDASSLAINPFSGLAEVCHNLLLHLPAVSTNKQFSLFINFFRKHVSVKNIFYPGVNSKICRIPRRIISQWWKLGWPPIDFYLSEVDIYHSLYIQVPPTRKIKTVLTIHDCRYLALPELYTPREVNRYRQQMKISLKRADWIVTVSEFTRKEVLNYFSFPDERLSVIYNGFTPYQRETTSAHQKTMRFMKMKNLPNVFLLYIGALEPRKNLGRLIEAIAMSKSEIPDFPDLVVAGIAPEKWVRSEYSAKAKKMGLSDHIHVCGLVEREVLTGLTRNAHALCYPSLYEGFGFPPLEAMSCEIPVLAANRASIPEVVGDAACLVDPESVVDIAHGLTRLVFDNEYRQSLITLGRDQVKKYSWHKTAEDHIHLYRHLNTL